MKQSTHFILTLTFEAKPFSMNSAEEKRVSDIHRNGEQPRPGAWLAIPAILFEKQRAEVLRFVEEFRDWKG